MYTTMEFEKSRKQVVAIESVVSPVAKKSNYHKYCLFLKDKNADCLRDLQLLHELDVLFLYKCIQKYSDYEIFAVTDRYILFMIKVITNIIFLLRLLLAP